MTGRDVASGAISRKAGSPRRARVVYFVAPSPDFAGIERTVHELATGLAEAGGDRLEVHVVFATRYDEAVLSAPLYTKHVLGLDRLLALPAAVRRSLKAIRPDVVIFPQVEAATIGWIASRGLGIPLFLAHLHGNPSIEEREGTRRTKLAFAVFRHIVSPRIGGVLAVSPSLAAFASRSLVRGAPVRFVPNPVRTMNASDDVPPRSGPFRFVSVGRLSYQKGQDLLLRAVRSARDGGLPAATVELVGEGEQREALEALAEELGVADLVTFAGYVTNPGERLVEADCFVLPSRWEGFGVALVEALQFGLPLLATDCQFGPADVITDRRIGLLVPSDDLEALGRGLVEMASRPSNAEDRAYRRAAAKPYERSTAIARHLEVLRELATVSGSRRLQPIVDVAG